MKIKELPAVTSGVTIALILMVSAGSSSLSISRIIAPPQAQAETVYYRCHGQYRWVPDGTIAGPMGGYPYYGWYGYPYVPYRCVRLHRRSEERS
jgi:hypothetical protein